MNIPRDRDSTGVSDIGVKSEGVHTKGLQRNVVKRRMEKRVEREVGQDLQADLGPGEGLEEKGRSKRLLDGKFITT